ncbi:indole-3-glycerol phosphate synthase TrpC [Tessaracoccus sp. MC1865]|uniref:indole-3-glycerol phosphate synthase TrpC n=1 Tax=Tessaracoccus sp. MC1865 TaxID=2760310 RepID=UPI0016040E43|nr:indole-3-glycerol phosphate synthase TrpC [Tessaracoccus sp. MC1865]MBB1483412.1 indole-3-glycerol phosphate synthase TrpC [Tessaracoccus sp. MC1865]QTO36518.1 indole-3-glycerol phosphate synthase TrpC [Tessaracoccus sp. MC1865]
MTVLDDIIAGVRRDLEERKARTSINEVIRAAQQATPALDPMPRFRAPELAVISEVKRKSPSKGDLAMITDPAGLAASYEAGGAAAISVLTEKHRFNGSLADLDAVRERVRIPVLRKDFMVEEYQFHEARAHGADLVLLIVASLTDDELTRFLGLTAELGMTALVETHTAEEVDRALAAGAGLIGVNNRNLKTLDVDLATFGRLAERIGDAAVKVAESGIQSADDVARVAAEGADVILVGEALVKHGDPTHAIGSFMAAAERAKH